MGKPYEVWFAIPSASVERCRNVLPQWRERGYRVAVLQNQQRGEIPADVTVWSDTYPGWAESINILCRDIVPKTADIVVSGGCDMLPDPNHSAQDLATQFFDKFPDGFGVMQPHGDAFMSARHYCGSPFLGRRWIDTMYNATGPMFGGYRHNWGDVELYWVAKCLGALWERPDLSHFHQHFTRDTGIPRYSWYTTNVARFDRRDLELHLARRRDCFPGCMPKGVAATFDRSLLEADTEKFAERQHAMKYGEVFEREKWELEQSLLDAMRWCERHAIDTVALACEWYELPKLRDVLMMPPIKVAALVHDGAAEQGKRLWGYDVLATDDVARAGVWGVLATPSVEVQRFERLVQQCSPGTRVAMRCGDSCLNLTQKAWCAARAVAWCRHAGRRRVGIFGAGRHTADLWATGVFDTLDIACIIDDAARPGQVFAGKRVVTLREASELALEAVILSSDVHQKAMLAACQPLERRGVAVVALYQDMMASVPQVHGVSA